MKRNLHLLIIDPQNDFCDLPAAAVPASESPALPVPGAHEDMRRVANLIEQGSAGLSGISITLDAHHRRDVAHPAFWEGVSPFTQITARDVAEGRYVPRDPDALPRVTDYLRQLEANGRYNLMVWPTHCEIGSWGHNVHADVRAAYNGWEERNLASVNKIIKGTNPWTEHYSAIQAEVPDESDPATQTNTAMIALLSGCDRVYITGEAGSHCVRATTEHLVAHWDPQQLARLVLVTDCMSAVTGFEAEFRDFVGSMQARGLTLATASDVLAELRDNA